MSIAIQQRKSYQLLAVGFFLLISFFLFTMPASADGGVSSGVDSILRSSSLEGNGEYRQTIAGYLNRPISFIITIAGFLIITFSFLKMVLTLLYLTFPTIFDQIDAHQKTSLQIDLRNAKPIDIISYVFALIMPNVKSLTDYANEDNQLDLTPIDYLKKKAPQLIFFIIIGAMIFDGQARNFIAKAADVGMFFGSMIESHDTVGAVRDFVNADGKYVPAFNTSTQAGKNQKKIYDEIERAINGATPIRGEEFEMAKGQLAEKITRTVQEDMRVVAKNGGIDNFGNIVSFSVSATMQTTQPNQANQRLDQSGVIYLNIKNVDSTLSDKILSKNGAQKIWLRVHYSQIADKNNRNILFDAPTTAGDKK